MSAIDDATLGPALLALARQAIADKLGVESGVTPIFLQVPGLDEALAEPAATFVTLTRHGALRGCIGTLEAHRALRDDVIANALAAAFRDPRFPPVSAAEWPTISLEVSRLTPAVPLPVADEADLLRQLRPQQDGIILRCGQRRATFLPQVWDQLPTPREFISRLKEKAGLPAHFWSPDMEVARYTVSKWIEDER